MPREAKKLKSARIDDGQLRRVKRFLGAKTDSQAIAMAIEEVDERRRFQELLSKYAGKIPLSAWGERD